MVCITATSPMPEFIKALLLGIIEGITEFLPISSTGHLLIAEKWLGHRSDLFNISIQAGAILAIVLIYREKLWALFTTFLGRDTSFKPLVADPSKSAAELASMRNELKASREYTLKLVLAFVVTSVLGILVKATGWELPENVRPIAWALIIGAVWMVIAEFLAAKRAAKLGEQTKVSWLTAVLVGVAQVVAGVFPGTSRSASTIFVALLAGTTSRAAATEFAFLVGIPTMFAATFYELLSLYRHDQIGSENWSSLAIAFVASTVTAFIAVKWLLRYIQTHNFNLFAVYRILLGLALLFLIPGLT